MALPTLDLFRGEAPSSISSSFCWAWVGDVRELAAALFRFRLSVCLWMQGSQLCQWNNYKILFSFKAVKFHRYYIEPAAFCTLVVQCHGSSLRMNDPRVASLSHNLVPTPPILWGKSPGDEVACPGLQARSATGGGYWSRNASRNGFWDRYWGRTSQLLANFFSLSLRANVPEVFAKINWAQFPSVASRVAGSRRFILNHRM